MSDLIEYLSNQREEIINEHVGNKDFNINRKQLNTIICALKMYNAFDDVLDEEIKIKHNGRNRNV